MPQRKRTPERLRAIHELAAGWGNIGARRAFGADGPDRGVDLTAMEQVAPAAADGVSTSTLEVLLHQQAQRLGAQQRCPGCGRVCPVGFEDRPLAVQGGRITYQEPVCFCPDCRRDFFPLRTALRLDHHNCSPSVLRRIAEAAARLGSFADASCALHLAGVDSSPRQVERIALEIGRELAQQRDGKVVLRRRRQLPVRVAVTPAVVAVEVAGGHLRCREAGCGPGVFHPQGKEDKVACLVTLRSTVSQRDPQPQPSASLLMPRRVQRRVQQIKGWAGDESQGKAGEEDTPLAASEPAARRRRPAAPQRWVRTCVASMAESRAFGPMVAAEAQERDFYRAVRRAFVGDGARYNGRIHQGYFRDFVAIADLLHVLGYLYLAAWGVGVDGAQRWSTYAGWLRAVWQGRVRAVIEELGGWQGRIGKPAEGEECDEKDPRRLVAEALGYLRNNASRMDYPHDRREGLPITSSLAESLVGESNARVRAAQKFWSHPQGAEAILQLRAAVLSEDDRLGR